LEGQKTSFSSSERKEFKHPKSMLSEKERTELLAAGKYFKCGECLTMPSGSIYESR